MKRGSPYDVNVNPYGLSQMEHISAQRMQQNLAVNSYSGRSDSFMGEEERQYTSTKTEGQWQWDRDAQQMSPDLHRDAQRSNVSRSYYPSQILGTKLSSDHEPKVHLQEQDMEIGYEDSPAPQTLERLDQKFHDDIMKLTKEQYDSEDAENDRHREKIIEINNQYQEKLSALRARHTTQREEFLRKESRARLQQYQVSGLSPYRSNSGPSDMGQGHHGYRAPDPITGEPQRQYGGGGRFESYGQRPELVGHERMQGAYTRIPTPEGRVYNVGPRYY